MEKIHIYSISDSVGETSESLIKAALCQFNYTNYEIKKFSFVSTLDELKHILEESKEHKSILFYTLVEIELVDYIKEFAQKNQIRNIDLLSEALNSISETLNLEPKREPGILRKLNLSYFNRIEAIEFAVKYDDGKDPRGFLLADIILLGISRTSKTPLSLYLANKNYKVANFPIVPNVPIPKELMKASPNKIFGLTISLDKVHAIRRERLKTLGFTSQSSYSDKEAILEEIEYANEVIRKIGCPIIDVSNKAIEETGDVILSYLNKEN